MDLLNQTLDGFFDQLLAPVWHGLDWLFAGVTLPGLCLVLGLGLALPQIYGLKNPAGFAAVVRRFPRAQKTGATLTLLATLWFMYNVHAESLADFASLKRYLLLGFLLIGLGTCLFVRDFLGARGAAVLLLLLAKLMVDTGRPHLGDQPLVLVIQVWAYVLAVAGMVFTVAPWRLRDAIEWSTASDARTRLTCGFRLFFGLFVAILGLRVF